MIKRAAIGIFLGLVAFSAEAKVSFQEAKQIFYRLERAAGVQGIPLRLIKSNINQAYSAKDHIGIYQGMLDFAQYPDEVARILGHELGHWVNRDAFKGKSFLSRKRELRADIIGDRLCRKLGYKKCLYELQHSLKYFGNAEDFEHPPYTERIDAVRRSRK